MKSILIVTTSCNQISADRPTGLWLEEFAVPYMEFKNNDVQITVASIEGGSVPIDPRGEPNLKQQEMWADAIEALKETQPVSAVNADTFDGVYLPGGHGTMFDFPDNKTLGPLLSDFYKQDKIIATVCHGPACLVGAIKPDGSPLVEGKTVACFTNNEEDAVGLTDAMPFLLETRLQELGADVVRKELWADHIEVDGQLITGQNPQSCRSITAAVLEHM